ncbi:hypothetical protein chiPu_0006883 [Chiloscyllium punctatum]|uniref:Uncharacterized protein n=1 Tax=Chiloscyllium punctatum TaxID=137246 RepID=A0A401SDM4_CHIPU|nr:hypothetical protein [Chiloscyllium punctatum]
MSVGRVPEREQSKCVPSPGAGAERVSRARAGQVSEREQSECRPSPGVGSRDYHEQSVIRRIEARQV